MMTTDPQVVSARAAAQMLGMTVAQVHKLRRYRAIGTAGRRAGRILFRRAEIEALARELAQAKEDAARVWWRRATEESRAAAAALADIVRRAEDYTPDPPWQREV